jgi:hypothetical protein
MVLCLISAGLQQGGSDGANELDSMEQTTGGGTEEAPAEAAPGEEATGTE